MAGELFQVDALSLAGRKPVGAGAALEDLNGGDILRFGNLCTAEMSDICPSGDDRTLPTADLNGPVVACVTMSTGQSLGCQSGGSGARHHRPDSLLYGVVSVASDDDPGGGVGGAVGTGPGNSEDWGIGVAVGPLSPAVVKRRV